MKRTTKKWLIVYLLIFLIGMSILPSGQAQASESPTIKSITATYPTGKTSATAFVDKFTLNFALDMPSMTKGEQYHVTFEEPNALTYNKSAFMIGNVFQITPDATGFTLIALENTSPRLVQVKLPVNYTKNVSGTEDIPLKVELAGQIATLSMQIQEYKVTVDPNELVKKVSLGFTKSGNLQWLVYYNYNQFDLKGTTNYPFVFKDAVGENQMLVKNSIMAYKVSSPIMEDGSRNLEHDAYDYGMSYFLQNQANDAGWNYKNTAFQGFPTLTGGTVPTTTSYYIMYETKVTDDGSNLYKNEVYVEGARNGDGGNTIQVQGNSPAQYQASATGGSGDTDELLGSLTFSKVDSVDNSLKLAGAEFTLVNQSTKQVYDTITTDDQGIGSLKDIPYGSYTLQEKKAPDGYKISSTTYPVIVSDNKQNVNLGEIMNDKLPPNPPVEITGSLTFDKVDSVHPNIKLSGAKFTLINHETTKIYATITTNDKGLGSLNNIPLGTYELRETEAPEGYLLSDKTYSVTISEEQQIIHLKDIPNEKKTSIPDNPNTPEDATNQNQSNNHNDLTKSQITISKSSNPTVIISSKELPKTGDETTTLPIIFGVLCLGVAVAVALLSFRRTQRK
ncbi:SpaA isopeptide-forming pilin-related protein [Listeria monocytogenes]